MQIVKNCKNEIDIFLEDGDTINVSLLKDHSFGQTLKCLNGILHIDDLTLEEIKNMSSQKKEIKKMEDYLNNN